MALTKSNFQREVRRGVRATGIGFGQKSDSSVLREWVYFVLISWSFVSKTLDVQIAETEML